MKVTFSDGTTERAILVWTEEDIKYYLSEGREDGQDYSNLLSKDLIDAVSDDLGQSDFLNDTIRSLMEEAIEDYIREI